MQNKTIQPIAPKPVSAEQVSEWKTNHGADKVAILEVQDKDDKYEIYFRKLDSLTNYFSVMSHFLNIEKEGKMAAGEYIFKTLYLGGLGDINWINKNNRIYVNVCIQFLNFADNEGLNVNFRNA